LKKAASGVLEPNFKTMMKIAMLAGTKWMLEVVSGD
jgi:hypothetical protein